MTCYLDWRAEPEIDVAEEIEIRWDLQGLESKEYTIICHSGICPYWDVVFSPSAAIAAKNAHVAWHEQGCPE